MHDILNLPLRALVARMAQRDVSAEAVTRACIERIEANADLQAWQFFDAELALQQARRLDAGPAGGALHGAPVGVKDLMDTADMPTTYGSALYAHHRPRTDAACVAASRTAGAIIMGKTVSTEFASFQAGPTRNPHSTPEAPHTPGGSSSGSAAAVAAGMVPLAFATQTAGSIVRPAAYCGIVGYKPSHGTLPLAGIKSLAPSLDTVGVLARSVDDAAFFVGALARLPQLQHLPAAGIGRLRVGICRTPHWQRADSDTVGALAAAARLLEQAGAVLFDLALPAACNGLTAAQIEIMNYEASAAFAPEAATNSAGFSNAFQALLAAGRAIDGASYFAAQKLALQARQAFDALFEMQSGGGVVDIVLAPSTEGAAPAGLDATGDPVFNRMWSLLGNPCVHVPLGPNAAGMPLGVTLIGPRWGDALTLAAALELERCHQRSGSSRPD